MNESNEPTATPSRHLAPAQIIAALEAWLPTRLHGQPVHVSDLVAPKGTGFSNQTYLFRAAWDGERHDLVVQAAPAGIGLFSRYDFASMARAQQRIGAVSAVPVPRVRWHESDPAPLGVPFSVMDRAPGQAPTDKPPYHRSGWFAELPAAQQTGAWWSGIEAMAALHRLEIERDGFAFLAHTPWGMAADADAASVRLTQWRNFMAWADPEPQPAIEAALNELERTRPRRRPLAVHWGDAKLSNCMVQHGTITALLDWELCGLSAPAEDLAHWLMLDWSLWAVNGCPRLAALPSPAETVARYEELTGRAAEAVPWWFRFGLVRLAIIYHRIMAVLRQRGKVAADARLAAVNPIIPFLAPIFEQDKLP